jgi:hypothetical protein
MASPRSTMAARSSGGSRISISGPRELSWVSATCWLSTSNSTSHQPSSSGSPAPATASAAASWSVMNGSAFSARGDNRARTVSRSSERSNRAEAPAHHVTRSKSAGRSNRSAVTVTSTSRPTR